MTWADSCLSLQLGGSPSIVTNVVSCPSHLKKKPLNFEYTLGHDVFKRVIIDSRLTFVPHVDSVIKKANRMCGLIWCNFRSFIMNMLCVLFIVHLLGPILSIVQ